MEAKREEEGIIMMTRLVEDADVAEMEVAATATATATATVASVEYSSPVPASGSGLYQCAVCYAPTTMRCSRCKAVRYWFVFFLCDYVFELLWCVISEEMGRNHKLGKLFLVLLLVRNGLCLNLGICFQF